MFTTSEGSVWQRRLFGKGGVVTDAFLGSGLRDWARCAPMGIFDHTSASAFPPTKLAVMELVSANSVILPMSEVLAERPSFMAGVP